MGEIRIRIFIQYSSSCFRSEEGAFSVKGKQWTKGCPKCLIPQLVRKYPLYFVHKQRILCHRPKFSTTLYWNGWLSMVPMSTSFRLQWMSKRSSTSTTSISTSTTTGHHQKKSCFQQTLPDFLPSPLLGIYSPLLASFTSINIQVFKIFKMLHRRPLQRGSWECARATLTSTQGWSSPSPSSPSTWPTGPSSSPSQVPHFYYFHELLSYFLATPKPNLWVCEEMNELSILQTLRTQFTSCDVVLVSSFCQSSTCDTNNKHIPAQTGVDDLVLFKAWTKVPVKVSF